MAVFGDQVKVKDFLGGDGMAEVVALGDVASIAGEESGGARVLDPFCHRGQAQGVREVDDRAHNRCGTGIFGDGGDERAAEFDFVDW